MTDRQISVSARQQQQPQKIGGEREKRADICNFRPIDFVVCLEKKKKPFLKSRLNVARGEGERAISYFSLPRIRIEWKNYGGCKKKAMRPGEAPAVKTTILVLCVRSGFFYLRVRSSIFGRGWMRTHVGLTDGRLSTKGVRAQKNRHAHTFWVAHLYFVFAWRQLESIKNWDFGRAWKRERKDKMCRPVCLCCQRRRKSTLKHFGISWSGSRFLENLRRKTRYTWTSFFLGNSREKYPSSVLLRDLTGRSSFPMRCIIVCFLV